MEELWLVANIFYMRCPEAYCFAKYKYSLANCKCEPSAKFLISYDQKNTRCLILVQIPASMTFLDCKNKKKNNFTQYSNSLHKTVQSFGSTNVTAIQSINTNFN
jgi:hypothetical protein